MNLRQFSVALSCVGGLFLLGAAAVLVSISTGIIGSTTTGPDGRTVVVERRTPPMMEESPRNALTWLIAAVVVSFVFALLIRFGGYVGPLMVMALLGPLVLISILTIGIFIAPAAGLFITSALFAIADRIDRRRAPATERPHPSVPFLG